MKARLLFLLIFCSVGTFAKVNQLKDSTNRPMSVLLKAQDVATAVSINQAKNEALLAFFQKEELVLSNAIKTNLNSQQTEAIQKQLKAEFQSILTPQELLLYSSKRKGAPYAQAAESGRISSL